MKGNILTLFLAAGGLLWGTLAGESNSDKSHKLAAVSLRKLADSLHAVIAADRRAYTELAAEPGRAEEVRPSAPDDQRAAPRLPGHAQMLRRAAQSIQQQGAEFSYTLRSLWPLASSGGPQTQAEQAGLEAVAKQPDQPFYTEEELGGRSYFTAVYADRATLPSCVSCHNQHPRSPKRDFKLGDVMGAIVVRVPLEF